MFFVRKRDLRFWNIVKPIITCGCNNENDKEACHPSISSGKA
jgi:hypothetical protein